MPESILNGDTVEKKWGYNHLLEMKSKGVLCF